MQEQSLARNQTTELPIVIKTTGLSSEAKEMLDAIARRAYEIFETKGKARGSALANWLQAEAELYERVPLNIGQSKEGITVLADVRDFTPKELEIDLEPKRVTIIGKCYPPAQAALETASGHAPEKLKTRLLRSVQLPVEIDARKATVRINEGMLELKLKKAAAAKSGSTKAPAGTTIL